MGTRDFVLALRFCWWEFRAEMLARGAMVLSVWLVCCGCFVGAGEGEKISGCYVFIIGYSLYLRLKNLVRGG